MENGNMSKEAEYRGKEMNGDMNGLEPGGNVG